MKEYYIQVTPADLEVVEAKLRELGYHSEEPWNTNQRGRKVDCVYTYDSGKYALHRHSGISAKAYRSITVSELLSLGAPEPQKNMTQLTKNQIVLYRDHDDQRWLPAHVAMVNPLCFSTDYGHKEVKWNQVIPFKGNEHLAGTTMAPSFIPQAGEWWMGHDGQGGACMVLYYEQGRAWVQAKGWVQRYHAFIPKVRMVKAE